MANVIQLKTGTSTPTTSDIVNGEVAIDKSAAKLYLNDNGTIKEIGGGGGVISDSAYNTVAGTNAGSALDSDTYRNTLFGKDAGKLINAGDDNTVFGYQALDATTGLSLIHI